MQLDPYHPTYNHFAVAHSHFHRGEYEAALAAARKVDIPDFFWTQIYLAAIYAELGRQSEAQSSVDKLLELYPGFTIDRLLEELRKHNPSEDRVRRWVTALRKAGLPEGTEA